MLPRFAPYIGWPGPTRICLKELIAALFISESLELTDPPTDSFLLLIYFLPFKTIFGWFEGIKFVFNIFLHLTIFKLHWGGFWLTTGPPTDVTEDDYLAFAFGDLIAT